MIERNDQTEKLIGRIHNWKFASAKECLEKLPVALVAEPDRDVIEALAATFGNCGWIDGHLATIAGCAVHQLIGDK